MTISKKRYIKKMMSHLVLITGTVTMIFPFYWMVKTSFLTDSQALEMPPRIRMSFPLYFGNYREIFELAATGRAIGNSLFIALVSTAGVLLTSSLAAFAFAKLSFPGEKKLFGLIFSTMLIPSQVTLIPLYVVFSKIGWIDTHLPLIVPQIMVNAYGVFLMRQFMLTVPDSYIEAAKLDGAGYTWIYARIMLPLCKSALITLGMFTFSVCRKGRTRLEKKKIRYISLKYKLSILLISLTLVPALTTGIFSYQILRRSLTENTQKSELSILENQMTNFDLAMHNFETILNDMVTSESTQGFLQFRKDKESEIYYSDLLILTSKLDSLINQRGDSLKMAAFLWNDGDLPLVRGDISGINLAGDYTSRKPFSGFLQADASIHWKVFYEKGEPVIYAYRTIYDTSANANIGVALINFSTDYFEELLTRAMDKNALVLVRKWGDK